MSEQPAGEIILSQRGDATAIGVRLEQLILAMGGKALENAGKVSHQQAVAHAETEYAKFRAQLAEQPTEVEAAYLETVKIVQKRITGKKKP